MSSNRFATLHTALLVLSGTLPATWAHAQASAPAAASQAQTAVESDRLDGRRNQKIEHLRAEDPGAVVDETRYGGRIQQITVSPKGGVPSYEVLPSNGQQQGRNHSESGPGGNGPRVWNVLKF